MRSCTSPGTPRVCKAGAAVPDETVAALEGACRMGPLQRRLCASDPQMLQMRASEWQRGPPEAHPQIGSDAASSCAKRLMDPTGHRKAPLPRSVQAASAKLAEVMVQVSDGPRPESVEMNWQVLTSPARSVGLPLPGRLRGDGVSGSDRIRTTGSDISCVSSMCAVSGECGLVHSMSLPNARGCSDNHGRVCTTPVNTGGGMHSPPTPAPLDLRRGAGWSGQGQSPCASLAASSQGHLLAHGRQGAVCTSGAISVPSSIGTPRMAARGSDHAVQGSSVTAVACSTVGSPRTVRYTGQLFVPPSAWLPVLPSTGQPC